MNNTLTAERITELSNKKGVKAIAVQNFLCSLNGMTQFEAGMNLSQDARAYKWNAATVAAIRQGIKEAKLGH